jgi:hypothetical protein
MFVKDRLTELASRAQTCPNDIVPNAVSHYGKGLRAGLWSSLAVVVASEPKI